MGREIYDIINDMAEVLNASQMHLKWAEIRCCTQYAVYSNELLRYINKD